MKPLLSLLAALVFSLPLTAAEPLRPDQVEQIERVVRDYLVRNPEVLLEAMRAYEERQRLAQEQLTREAIAAHARELFDNPDDPVAGNPRGDLTVVEFFDYKCPYCKQAGPVMDQAVKTDGRVRIVYKEFPILGPESVLAARYGVAAMNQPGKYAAFRLALLATRGTLSEAVILQVAGESGLDLARLKKDAEDPRVERILRANRALGEALGISGTPAFVIGDELVPGAVPAERITALFDAARARTRASGGSGRR